MSAPDGPIDPRTWLDDAQARADAAPGRHDDLQAALAALRAVLDDGERHAQDATASVHAWNRGWVSGRSDYASDVRLVIAHALAARPLVTPPQGSGELVRMTAALWGQRITPEVSTMAATLQRLGFRLPPSSEL